MTDVEELLFRPAIEVAALVQHKQISARELTEALLGKRSHRSASAAVLVRLLARLLIRG